MTSVSHGNDPDALDAIGEALRREAERLEGVGQWGRSGLGLLGQAWAGPDLDHVDASWRVAESQLQGAVSALRTAGERAVQQAADQRSASGEGGGASSPFAGIPTSARPDDTSGRDGGSGPERDPEDLPIPIPDDGRPWTPQGMGYSEELDAYVHVMYDHDDGDSGVVAIQPADGGPVRYVPIEGNNHYGGIAVDGDDVYVSGNGAPGDDGSHVQRYDLSALDGAATPGTDGPVVPPSESVRVPTGSTLTVHDGTLTVAEYANHADDDYEPGQVYEYQLGPRGELPGVPAREDYPVPSRTFEAPPNIQGLTMHDGAYYFTQSRGPDDPSNLVRVDPATGEQTVVRDDLSPLSQGLVSRGDHLVVTSESGAEPYRQDVLDSDNPWLPNAVEHPVTPEDHLQEVDVP